MHIQKYGNIRCRTTGRIIEYYWMWVSVVWMLEQVIMIYEEWKRKTKSCISIIRCISDVMASCKRFIDWFCLIKSFKDYNNVDWHKTNTYKINMVKQIYTKKNKLKLYLESPPSKKGNLTNLRKHLNITK